MSSSNTNTTSDHNANAMSRGELLSAFMDGEIEVQAAAFFVRQLTRDDALDAEWRSWHMVRDHLRSGGATAALGRTQGELSLAARVSAAIAQEDALTVSRPVATAWSQRLFRPVASAAIAASVAMAAIIGVNQYYNATLKQPGDVLSSIPTAGMAANAVRPNLESNGTSLLSSPSVPLEAVPVGLSAGPALRQDPLARARLEAYLLRHYSHARMNGSASFVGYMSNFNQNGGGTAANAEDTAALSTAAQRGQNIREHQPDSAAVRQE